MADFVVVHFLELAVRNLPALVMLAICAIVTWSQRQRHPTSARWAFFAFAWFLAVDFIIIGWYSIRIFVLANDAHAEITDLISGMVLSCMEALGFLFFFLAVNAARTPYRPRTFFDDFGDDDPPPKAPQAGKDQICEK
jgi:hypothetical protein